VVSYTPGLDLVISTSPTYSDLVFGGSILVASASVKPVGGGQPPLLFASVASSGLLELGAVWKFIGAGQPAQFALSEVAPSLALVGSGPSFLDVSGDCSSGADVLGKRLRCSFLVMLESGAPTYPSESKSVHRYSRKPKVGRMDELLLAEALAAINAPLLLCHLLGL